MDPVDGYDWFGSCKFGGLDCIVRLALYLLHVRLPLLVLLGQKHFLRLELVLELHDARLKVEVRRIELRVGFLQRLESLLRVHLGVHGDVNRDLEQDRHG